MEPATTLLLIVALAVCAYMAWNIGANDVANAMGTSVGSRALTLKQAVVIAAVFEFAGAFFAGDAVTETVRKGILTVNFELEMSDPDKFYDLSQSLALGFVAAMMAAAVWLTVATRMGLPVSTTHSIIGGIIGVGLILEVQFGEELIDWSVVRKVVMSWVASPLIGGILAFLSFAIVRATILDAENPTQRAKTLAPILALPTFFVLGLALLFKALKGFFGRIETMGIINSKYDWLPVKEGGSFNPFTHYCPEGVDVVVYPECVDAVHQGAWFPINALLFALAIGIFASVILHLVLRKVDLEAETRGFKGVERIFVWLQIITAAYVAFAHGANDRSNAIGPMAAVYQVLSSETGMLAAKADIPLWLILIGSAGIAIGVVTWGWRVMETIGSKITDITPTRGFAAEFGAATTILAFSMPFLAVPVSTTHTLVGAVVGVGLAGGAKAVDFRVFGKIAASWVASLPAAAFGSVVLLVLSGGDFLTMVVLVTLAFVGVATVMWRTKDNEIHVEEALADIGGDGAAVTPLEIFREHATAVTTTVDCMLEAVDLAIEGDEKLDEAVKATSEAEHKADQLKATLREALSTPSVRLIASTEEKLHMITRQDRIADYAENVAEQLSFRPLFDDETAKKNLQEMAQAVRACVGAYEETVRALRDYGLSGETRKGANDVRELIRKVNLLEHEADLIEAKAAAHVFSEGGGDPLAAVHMYRVLQRMDDVANACEKAANAFLPLVNR
jgi:predicted phosphate transport protein (TIGR00153 family)